MAIQFSLPVLERPLTTATTTRPDATTRSTIRGMGPEQRNTFLLLPVTLNTANAVTTRLNDIPGTTQSRLLGSGPYTIQRPPNPCIPGGG